MRDEAGVCRGAGELEQFYQARGHYSWMMDGLLLFGGPRRS